MSGLAEQGYPDPKRLLRRFVPHRGQGLHAGIGSGRFLARAGCVFRLGGTAFFSVPRFALINSCIEPGAQACHPQLPASAAAFLKDWAAQGSWHGSRVKKLIFSRRLPSSTAG